MRYSRERGSRQCNHHVEPRRRRRRCLPYYPSVASLHLGAVHPLQDVALHQGPLLSSAQCCPAPVAPSLFIVSSCRLLLGRPLGLFPLLGCHSVHLLVHLMSFILAICPAHFHSYFRMYSMTSAVIVLFLISEHGTINDG